MSGTLNSCAAEYSKDPKIKPEDIRTLMEWVEKEPHMPKVDEYMLIQFYFASNYSIQQAKNLIELHYAFRNEAPEFFSTADFDPEKCKYSVWDVIYAFTIPQPTAEKRRIYYTSLKDTDSHKYNFEKALSIMVSTLLTTILEEGICPGYEIIFDLKGFSLPHFATVTISLIRKLVYFAQDLTPLVIKGIHIINGYKIFDKFMFLAERFMKKELFEIIHIHSKPDDLFKFVPKENIPIDMGGTYEQTKDELQGTSNVWYVEALQYRQSILPSSALVMAYVASKMYSLDILVFLIGLMTHSNNVDLMKAKVTAFATAILKEYTHKIDESKRIGEKNNMSMNGTFRRLELD